MRTRVTLIAAIASGAMAQTLECLAVSLSQQVDITLVTPAHYAPPRELAEVTVPFHSPLDRRARAFYWFSPWQVPNFGRMVRGTRPDVVHLFNGPGYLQTLALPSLVGNAPLMVTVHDPVAHSGSHADAVATWLGRKILLPRSERLHAMSNYAERILVQQGFPREKIVVTRHGALTSVFEKHNRPGLVRGNSLLFFGRWEHYKGIDILVNAIVLLAKRGVPQHCILAGRGEVPTSTRQLIAAHPELFEVHNDYLSDADVAGLFQRANRTVLPYRDATQSSLPALAQAYGHGIIATRVGAFEEEVSLLGGILVEPDNVEALADGIELSRHTQVSPEGSIDYSWDTVAEQLVAAYNKM